MERCPSWMECEQEIILDCNELFWDRLLLHQNMASPTCYLYSKWDGGHGAGSKQGELWEGYFLPQSERWWWLGLSRVEAGRKKWTQLPAGAKEAVTCEWISLDKGKNNLYNWHLKNCQMLKVPPTISYWRINSTHLLSRNSLCFHFSKRTKESLLQRS